MLLLSTRIKRAATILIIVATATIKGANSVDSKKRQLGENYFPQRSNHGACDIDDDGKEMACIQLDGYFQCAKARGEGGECGKGNRFNECQQGLWCPGVAAWQTCAIAPSIGAPCAAPVAFDCRNVCGFQGYCDASTNICRHFAGVGEPCTPNSNYGFRECEADLTCNIHSALCEARANDGKGCQYDQDCADGYRCYFWRCQPFANLGETCDESWECLGNLECRRGDGGTGQSSCHLRSDNTNVVDIIPTPQPNNPTSTSSPIMSPSSPQSATTSPPSATTSPPSATTSPPSTSGPLPMAPSIAPSVLAKQSPHLNDENNNFIENTAAVIGSISAIIVAVMAILGYLHQKKVSSS